MELVALRALCTLLVEPANQANVLEANALPGRPLSRLTTCMHTAGRGWVLEGGSTDARRRVSVLWMMRRLDQAGVIVVCKTQGSHDVELQRLCSAVLFNVSLHLGFLLQAADDAIVQQASGGAASHDPRPLEPEVFERQRHMRRFAVLAATLTD